MHKQPMTDITDQGRVTLDFFQGQLNCNKTTVITNVHCNSSDTI